jgi:hypothetical protein
MALTPRATPVLQWPIQRVANPRGGANRIKIGLSSDNRLKLACLKLESLVNVGQHTTLNTFPGLVHTARHVMKVRGARSAYLLSPKANLVIGTKS